MEIKIINVVCTSVLTFDKIDSFREMIKSIDNCLEDYNKSISYKALNVTLKFGSDYLRNSMIEIRG